MSLCRVREAIEFCARAAVENSKGSPGVCVCIVHTYEGHMRVT